MSNGKPGTANEFALGMFMVHDIVEDNGKTIRENNLEKRHAIPVGTLVEVKYDEWHGDGACTKVRARLWVVHHARDCDGTPLYVLGKYRGMSVMDPKNPNLYAHGTVNGLSEDALTPVELTQALRDGYGALEWDEDEPNGARET